MKRGKMVQLLTYIAKVVEKISNIVSSKDFESSRYHAFTKIKLDGWSVL